MMISKNALQLTVEGYRQNKNVSSWRLKQFGLGHVTSGKNKGRGRNYNKKCKLEPTCLEVAKNARCDDIAVRREHLVHVSLRHASWQSAHVQVGAFYIIAAWSRKRYLYTCDTRTPVGHRAFPIAASSWTVCHYAGHFSGATEIAELECNGPKSHRWKMKDQRPQSISYTTHVVFTSSNIQKFQHEKPFIVIINVKNYSLYKC